MSADDRLEFSLRTEAEERAAQVVAERAAKTVVPASFFDDLVAAMDAPVRPGPALRKAVTAARANITAGHLHP